MAQAASSDRHSYRCLPACRECHPVDFCGSGYRRWRDGSQVRLPIGMGLAVVMAVGVSNKALDRGCLW